MRLDRFLSMAGYGSRTDVRDLVRTGRVRVTGEVVRDPGLRLSDGEPPAVEVDGSPAEYRRWIHLMLHKPAGVVTAMDDPRHPTVAGLVPPRYLLRGVTPVGRLDIDVTGLLVLTSDGVLAHRLASPKWGVDKTYRIEYEGPEFTDGDAAGFAAGLALADGTVCLPARLEPVREGLAMLTIHEGRFHQVKNMVLAAGRRLTALSRIRTGPLSLDPALPPGECRELTAEEAGALYASVRLDSARE